MKRLLTTIAVVALAPATALAAGVDLSWNNCAIGAGVQSRVFNRTQTPSTDNTSYSLYFQVKPAQDLPDFVAVECYADLEVPGPIGSTSSSPQAFWRYQQGGCNTAGVTAFDVIPASCRSNGYLDFAGGDGSGALETLAYREDWDGSAVLPGNGHFIVVDARDGSLPMAVTAGANYSAAELRFNNLGRATCAGCDQPACIAFNRAILRGASGASIIAEFADKGSNGVALNGGNPNKCIPDLPVQTMTWARIKTLYR